MNCMWVFLGAAHETVVYLYEPMCIRVQCVHMSGILVVHVCVQAHFVCVYVYSCKSGM